MSPSIGVNLRVTGHCSQGGRKYMEDMFSVAYHMTEDRKDLEYAFFGIFDGHGGQEAAKFAKEHLLDNIVSQKDFWSDDDEAIMRSIRKGFMDTHEAMWHDLENWPRTASGLTSTSGTTATIGFVKKSKIYIGHVGDSGIVLGYKPKGDSEWKGKALTKDHKPEDSTEIKRIQMSGGKVVAKSGVPRVVWNRPRLGHKGPIRRSTCIEEIPFLAVARSLGDLWSFNPAKNSYVVSPVPDVQVFPLDVTIHKCLIFGTDGLWNVLSPDIAVSVIQSCEMHNGNNCSQNIYSGKRMGWVNPSMKLVEKALERWNETQLRADNTSVVTLILDPPGPPQKAVLFTEEQTYQDNALYYSPASTVRAELDNSEDVKPFNAGLINNDMRQTGLINYHSPGGRSNLYPKVSSLSNQSCPLIASSYKSGQVFRVGSVLQRDSPSHINKYSQQHPSLMRNAEAAPDDSFLQSRSSIATPVERSTYEMKRYINSETCSTLVGVKRRHSSAEAESDVSKCVAVFEPGYKRRTRSEDKRLSVPLHEEDFNGSDVENNRLIWNKKWGKKAKVPPNKSRRCTSEWKTIGGTRERLRLSVTKSFTELKEETIQMEVKEHSNEVKENTKVDVKQDNSCIELKQHTRILRSETAASTPFKTLRSRNVNTELLSSISKPKRVNCSMRKSTESASTSLQLPKGLQKRSAHWKSRSVITRSKVRRRCK